MTEFMFTFDFDPRNLPGWQAFTLNPEEHPMTTITTANGVTRTLPDNLDPERVAGLDEEGRFVVDDFGARTGNGAHMFGLTLCCNAYDKGCEDGVFCRGCYGGAPNPDEGHYLFPDGQGQFPGLDPVVKVG